MSGNPVKFKPIFKERIWGSNRLKKLFNKNLPPGKPIGESWELADLPDDCSVVAEGEWAGMTLRELLAKHGKEIGFTPLQCEHPFGLLIKFLDAHKVLSVQVHPDEKTCRLYPGAQMKTESWYVLDAQPEAVTYRGLKPQISREDLENALKQGNIEQMMQVYPAQKGQVHFLPAGTIHALGAQVVVAEIQTPSDTTYRLYDWNRLDEYGKGRELQVEQALNSINYNAPPPAEDNNGKILGRSTEEMLTFGKSLGVAKLLVDCPYFSVLHLQIEPMGNRPFRLTQPVVMINLAGAGMIGNYPEIQSGCRFFPGDTLLLPKTQKGLINLKEPGECLLVSLGTVKA